MPKARLYNDNDHDYETTFKGDPVKIKAHAFMEGDLFDLNDLKGQYHPIVWLDDVARIQDPRSFKKLRLVRMDDDKTDVGHKCMQCKLSLPSEKTLAAHVEEAHANAAKVDSVDQIPMATSKEEFSTSSHIKKGRATGTD